MASIALIARTQRICPVFCPALASSARMVSPSPAGLVSGLFAMEGLMPVPANGCGVRAPAGAARQVQAGGAGRAPPPSRRRSVVGS